jgi:hypothetical protein
MTRHTQSVVLICVLLCGVALFWGSACDSGGQLARHRGGPGYSCFFDTDCLEPLVCESTPSAEFPVCTGLMLEGDACQIAYDCAWIRDDLGLPLSCLAEGVCGFVSKDDNG